MKTIRLENGQLELEAVPECGGKLIQLRSLRSGRSWLWSNPHLPLQPPTYGVSYVQELDSGGWDEILPSVAPCSLVIEPGKEIAIPDHGEIVGLPWHIEAADRRELRLSVQGRVLPLHFTRTIQLGETTAQSTFRYVLQNLGTKPLPFLSAAHPLFNLVPGMPLELPAGTRARVAAVVCGPDRVAGAEFNWPRLGIPGSAEMDLSQVPDRRAPSFVPLALKIFTGRLHRGEVALAVPDGDRLLLRFDAAAIGFLGLWINYGGWSGCGSAPYFNLGVEPTTAPCDDLSEAVRSDLAHWLLPGERRMWALEVTL